MGYSTAVTEEAGSGSWVVTLRVTLDRAESNTLFLSGDAMVSWPVEGLQGGAVGGAGLERTGMFVSEVAARPSGLGIRYLERNQAERAATLLRLQFQHIGIKEEA
jgi:hypothetical protein